MCESIVFEIWTVTWLLLRECSAAWTGLPPRAYIVGLPLGVTVPVEIVVFADDGTTSSKYTLLLTRQSRNEPTFSNSRGNLFAGTGVSVTKMAGMSSRDRSIFSWHRN